MQTRKVTEETTRDETAKRSDTFSSLWAGVPATCLGCQFPASRDTANDTNLCLGGTAIRLFHPRLRRSGA